MSKPLTVERLLPYALLGMTAVTGLVDAVSFLALGHVFTANMTGNVVFLAFAVAGAPDVSLARSLTALVAFFVGAAIGGRGMAGANPDSPIRAAMWAFGLEVALLLAATLTALGVSVESSAYALIVLTALAMGIRNAAVRKLAVPDLTTTVLTLTITGLAADSSLARGNNPRWGRRLGSILAMALGAALGAVALRHSVFLALALAAAASATCSLALLACFRLSLRGNAAKG